MRTQLNSWGSYENGPEEREREALKGTKGIIIHSPPPPLAEGSAAAEETVTNDIGKRQGLQTHEKG